MIVLKKFKILILFLIKKIKKTNEVKNKLYKTEPTINSSLKIEVSLPAFNESALKPKISSFKGLKY